MDWTKHEFKQTNSRSAREIFRAVSISVVTNVTLVKATYKQEDAMTGVAGCMMGRVIKMEEDSFGIEIWSRLRLVGK